MPSQVVWFVSALIVVGVAVYLTSGLAGDEGLVSLVIGALPSSLTSLRDVTEKSDAGRSQAQTDRVMSKAELVKYDGGPHSPGLYLAVMGRVYDVSQGKKHYGPGKSYHFFAAKDGSRGFATGDFSDVGLVDDVATITPAEAIALNDWVKFYDKSYKYIGRLSGYFYDESGVETDGWHQIQRVIEEGRKNEADEEADKKLFPLCNSEWSAKDGGRVYCTKNSGGIERDWVGVPRKYFKPGSVKPRCACVRDTGPPTGDPDSSSNHGDLHRSNVQEYPDCNPRSTSCRIP